MSLSTALQADVTAVTQCRDRVVMSWPVRMKRAEFLCPALFTLCASFLIIPASETAIRLADMRDYRLFVYNQNGQIVGPATVISAANDDEAIAQAEALRGSLAAELLDFDGLRIVKRLPPNGKAPSEAAK